MISDRRVSAILKLEDGVTEATPPINNVTENISTVTLVKSRLRVRFPLISFMR